MLYVKLFSKILNSSIWMETPATKVVWFTLLCSMNRTGFAQFASIRNLAHAAVVSVEEAEKAIECLTSPDPDSTNPENEGKRIERVSGGFMVLNAEAYMNIKNQVGQDELNRQYQQDYRDKQRKEKLTDTNANLTSTYSSNSISKSVNSITKNEKRSRAREGNGGFDKFWSAYPRKCGKGAAEKSWNSIHPSESLLSDILTAVDAQKKSKQWSKDDGQFIPMPATWLNQHRWQDQLEQLPEDPWQAEERLKQQEAEAIKKFKEAKLKLREGA